MSLDRIARRLFDAAQGPGAGGRALDAAAVAAMLAQEIPDDPPAGFEPLPTGPGFNLYLGPIYGRLVEGRLRLGLRVGRRHINPHDSCHGGVLAAFADMQVYVSQQEDERLRPVLTPTIGLTLDFISPATLGEWLEGDTTLLRGGATTLFQQTLGRVGERLVFRASCVYRITRHPAPEGSALGDQFR